MSKTKNAKTQDVATPIAIVGMAGMFPKSPDLKGFWHLIRGGISGISDVPDTHWNPADYFDADPKAPDKTYCKRGGFLPKHPFDPTEFSLPPAALEATDTTQLLGLVVAKAALDDAGYGADRVFNRSKTSIVLGVTGTLELVIPLGARLGHPIWRKAMLESGIASSIADEVLTRMGDGFVPWQENSFPGLLGNVVAGRIANRLDLHGTNCVVDAACASSLSAAHLAIMELATGKADVVVTGGTDTFNDIFMYMCFSKTPALSASGNIRPFSEASDGTLIGEGLGMVVLKRLEDAKADGDRVYAVIRGIGTASDGNSGAVYAPSSPGQARCLRDAYENSGVSPSDVRLVEAHGTGTKVGDVVEFEGLRSVYADYSNGGERKGWVALGSVKSQIGHTKAAAGAASLIKAALALHYKVLPPTLGVEKPNPKMKVDESPFYINTEARPWVSEKGIPRYAALSSFGFGGSNFHMVLEEAEAQRKEVAWDGAVRLFAFSAVNASQLADKIRAQAKELAGKDPAHAAIAAHKSTQTFDAKSPARAVVLWKQEQSVQDALSDAASKVSAGQAVEGPDLFASFDAPAGKLVFMFPGQGSQYPNMGRELACLFPEFLNSIEDGNLASPDGRPVSKTMYPNPTFSEDVKKSYDENLTKTDSAQPALGVMNRALFDILTQRFGLNADFACGHSYGELCALYAAGAYDAASLNRLSNLRGELMAKGDGGRGGMVAVSAPIEKVEAAVAELGLKVVVANRNSPTQCVLSGEKEAIKDASAKLKDLGMKAIPLQVGAAFHSSLVSSAEKPFRDGLESIKFSTPKVQVVANKTALAYPSEAKQAKDLLANQLVSQVNWIQQVEYLHQQGAATFVEVGPKTVLSKLVGSILKGKAHKAISLDASAGKNGLLDLARGLAQLAALGYPVKLSAWEEAPAEPRARRMTVELTGANYRSPHGQNLPPVREPNSVVSKSSLKTAALAADKRPVTITARIDEKAPAASAVVARPNPPAPKPAVSAPAKAVAPAPQVLPKLEVSEKTTMTHTFQAGQSLVAAGQQTVHPWAQQAFQEVQTTLLAVQALQQQTAKTHQKFLEGQEAAQKTFQMLVENQRLMMQALTQPGFVVSQPAAPVARAVQPAPVTVQAIQPVKPVAVPVAKPAPVAPASSSNGGSYKPAAVAPKAAPAPVAKAAPAPVVAAAPSLNIEKTVLALVAEKTGYPVEMLTLDMDLEADLGIDSIKRVEILAGAQEKLPGSAALPSDQMGSLRTLKEVVQALQAAVPAGASAPAAKPVAAPAVGKDTSAQLLAVVAEKTGYPVDMLNLSMDMEADLGIDSIKRVEILASVEEKVPGLPKIAPDQLGALRTLQEIVDAFGVASPAASPGAAAPAKSNAQITSFLSVISEKTGYPVETLNVGMDLESDLGIDSIKRVEILAAVEEAIPGLTKIPPDRLGSLRTVSEILVAFGIDASGASAAPVAAAPQGDVSGQLLKVVADKTGYPVDMLNLSMDMEADLGIDSIKRVEILAAVEEAVPGLPKIEGDRLGALRTLGEIVEAFGVVPGAAPVAAAPVAAAVASSLSADLSAALLAVVADKTGYPVDMLKMEMDMEADLGIDSIKRVEILAAVEEKVPGLNKVDGDKLGSLRTLAEIAQALIPASAPVAVAAPVAAAPVVNGSSQNGSAAVVRRLLEVVAEKTGYPVDMLNVDMDLEADLGIDSIKRVEILAAVEEKVPGLNKVDGDKLGALRTLKEVADALTPKHQAVVAAPVSSATNGSAVVKAQKLERRVLTSGSVPASAAAKLRLPAGSRVAVLSEKDALADALSEQLKKQGFNVVHELSDSEKVTAAIIVGNTQTGNDWIRKAFTATRSLASHLQKTPQALFATVARMDGKFGLTGVANMSGGLTGLPKTAAHEWEGVDCRAFDVDSSWKDTKAAATAILNELAAGGPLELGLSAKGNAVLETPEEVCGASSNRLTKGDLVLVTGGARGVTADCAIALAKAVQPTLILLGRSAPPQAEPAWLAGLKAEGEIKRAILSNHFQGGKATPKEVEQVYRQFAAQREVQGTIDQIKAAGAAVEYRSLDVRNVAAIEALVAQLRKSYGPVCGLIHAAGVLADKRIEEKTDEMFEGVFSTKVEGIQNLLKVVTDDLKSLVFFSSVTARFGRPGQVDYCVSNDILNKMAQTEAKKRPKTRVVSLNWGPWEGGMVTEGLKKEFTRLGVGLISLDAGAQALVNDMCAAPGGAVEVLYGDSFPAPPQKAAAEQVAFETTVSVAEYPVLESHQVGGRPVVPVAMMVEWLGHAALHGKIGPRFTGLKDLQVFRPIALDQPSITVQVLEVSPDTFEIRSGAQLHARAVVTLAAELPSAPAARETASLVKQDYPFNPQQVYEQHLFHGSHFQGIKSVKGWSPSGMVADIQAVAKVSDWIQRHVRTDWIADPLALDIALQMGILWGIQQLGAPSLPMKVTQYTQFQKKFPKNGLTAQLRATQNGSHKLSIDVDFVDKEGKVVAALKGVEFVADASLAKAFGRPVAARA